MKNKIFILLVLASLSLPINTWAVDDYATPATTQEEIIETDSTLTQNGIETTSPVVNTYKQPISKRKIAKKFLTAMFGVLVSSLVIFLGLSLYNKIREGFIPEIKTPEGETPLKTPENIEEAVKTFLDKTKWK